MRPGDKACHATCIHLPDRLCDQVTLENPENVELSASGASCLVSTVGLPEIKAGAEPVVRAWHKPCLVQTILGNSTPQTPIDRLITGLFSLNLSMELDTKNHVCLKCVLFQLSFPGATYD